MSKVTQEKKLKKQSAKKEAVEKTELEVSKIQFCCKCKNHDNHPSFCKPNKKYVARKAPACEFVK